MTRIRINLVFSDDFKNLDRYIVVTEEWWQQFLFALQQRECRYPVLD